MLDDRMAGDPPNRGWNRASIIFWSRKPYRPRIREEDRRLPTELSALRLVATCIVTASCVGSVLLWPPLFIASVFLDLSGALFGAFLGGAVVALTFVFYFWVTAESRHERRSAAQRYRVRRRTARRYASS